MKVDKLIKFLIILTTGFLCVLPLHNNSLNYLFRIPSLILIVWIISKVYFKINNGLKYSVWGFIAVILANIAGGVDLTFTLFLNILSVVLFLQLVIISDHIYISPKTRTLINRCAIFSVLVLYLYSVSGQAHQIITDEGDVLEIRSLTYGLENSNFAGLLTLCVFGLLYVSFDSKNVITKIVNLTALFLCGYLAYETETRTVMASIVLIPVIDLFMKNRKFNDLILGLILLIPFVFVPIYLYLVALNWGGNIEFNGKSGITGRDEVYFEFIANIQGFWDVLLGNFDKNKLMNAHNGPLAIFASTGLLGTFFYFFIYIKKIYQANKCAITRLSRLGVVVLIACFINTCGEAAMLLGGFPFITYCFLFFAFAFGDKNIKPFKRTL